MVVYTVDTKSDDRLAAMAMVSEDERDDDEGMSTESSGGEDDKSDDSPMSTIPRQRPANEPLFLNFTSDLLPQKSGKSRTKKRTTAYRVNGVNILNRSNLDSKTVNERIQRRRENHNHVERRRRDNINNTILELSQVIPNAVQPGQKPNKGNILRLALDYIKYLQTENDALRRLGPPPPIASAPNSPTRFVPPLSQPQQSASVPTSPTHMPYREDPRVVSAHLFSRISESTPPLPATSSLPPLTLPQAYHPVRPVSVSSPVPFRGPMPAYPPPAPRAMPHQGHIPTYPNVSHPTRPVTPTSQLPASVSPSPNSSSTHYHPILPVTSKVAPALIRMGGYEKIYSGACRY